MSATGANSEVTRVLMVCSGNICRSPLAELLLKQALHESHTGRRFEVFSAGTIAIPGQRMPEEAVRVAVAHGIAESVARAHRATRLIEQYVEDADLVLGMAREHRSAAVELVPRALRRVFTLREFTRLATAEERASNLTGKQTSGELVARLAAQRVATLGDPQQDDVPDPYGDTSHVYDMVGAEIAVAVTVVTNVMG